MGLFIAPKVYCISLIYGMKNEGGLEGVLRGPCLLIGRTITPSLRGPSVQSATGLSCDRHRYAHAIHAALRHRASSSPAGPPPCVAAPSSADARLTPHLTRQPESTGEPVL